MTLTARLMAFTLLLLAVVLLGFSSALYLLARTYLHGQAETRVAGALTTLAASAEIEPHGIDWDPHERHWSVRPEVVGATLRWSVTDGEGRRVDSSSPNPDNLRMPPFPADAPKEQIREVLWEGEPWLVGQLRLEAERAPPPRPAGEGPGSSRSHGELVITVAEPLAPQRSALFRLAAALAGVSLGLWLLTALLGRFLCRRALLPLTRMAAGARSLSAVTLDQRLPQTKTGDEVDELGRAFNELLTRLQESFERQRRFTGDASHQLRTPLTALLGQLEVALRRERPPEEYRRVLASAQQQAVQLRQIVEALLFLSRAEAEARLPDLETVELSGWLTAHLASWSEHPRHDDLRLTISDSPLWARAYPPLLGQLVDNLLDNACKYSDPGTVIRIRSGKEAVGVFLAVEDEGAGIAAEDLPRIFEPFYRSTEARSRGGIGLGLAVVQRIAVAFGGSVSVSSHAGKGTTVTLRLAAADAPSTIQADAPGLAVTSKL